MGSVLNVISEWVEDDEQKELLYERVPSLVLRWINEAQLRHVDRSEVLREIWEPTITSTGNTTLPSDFLREIKDRVKWDTTTHLYQVDYPAAALVESWSDTSFYSIWESSFYVWGAAAGTPSIPYIKKPAALTTIATDNLELPTENHGTLQIYLDAVYARRNKDFQTYYSLLDRFDRRAQEEGGIFRNRRDPIPTMRSSRF